MIVLLIVKIFDMLLLVFVMAIWLWMFIQPNSPIVEVIIIGFFLVIVYHEEVVIPIFDWNERRKK